MATKIKYTATAPDGSVFARSSNRTYTHAVLIHDAKGWGILGFNGSHALAIKASANSWIREHGGTALVVEAQVQ